MDISEFLAASQTSAPDRMLARNTRMGIPDADNDPRTKDAAPTQDLVEQEQGGIDDNYGQGGFDDTQMGMDQEYPAEEQSFAEGGEVEGDAFNNADRSGDKTLEGGFSNWLDREEEHRLSRNVEDRRGDTPEGTVPKDWVQRPGTQQGGQRAMDEGVVGKRYDEGGPVEEEPVVEEPVQQMGAIPEPEGEQPPAAAPTPAPRGFQARREQKNAENNWRASADEGINAALEYGRNVKHAVNRPVSDETHERDHRAYLTGEGAMDPQQFAAAQQSVDPDGTMDKATRLQKTIGSVYDFYKGKYGEDSQEPGTPAAKAAWSIVQLARKTFNASSTHAIVAGDKGNDVSMAASAEMALNAVPDGLLAQVKFQGAGAGGPMDPSASSQQHQPMDRIGMGDPAMSLEGGKFQVTLTDPESGKPVTNVALTKPQLQHVLAEGYDRTIERGSPASIERAAQMKPGEEKHPKKSFGQQLAEANGLPPGISAQGMSTMEIKQLRGRYNDAVARRGGLEDPTASRERIATQTNQTRERMNTETNQTRAGNNQTTNQTKTDIAGNRELGLNGRQINSPSQQAQNDRAILNRATAAAENWAKNERVPPTEQQKQAYIERAVAHLRTQMQPSGVQQPAQQQTPPAAGAPQTKEYGGKTYIFDPAKKGWVAQ